MAFDLLKIIRSVGVESIKEKALQIVFGKVVSTNPLKIKIGDTWTLTEEFIVLDAPVYNDEEVIVIKYSIVSIVPFKFCIQFRDNLFDAMMHILF